MTNVRLKDADGVTRFFEAVGTGTSADPYNYTVSQATTGPQKRLFSYRLDQTGDGTGNTDMAVDGSSTAVTFRLKPAATEIYRLARIIVYVEDNGNFDATKWGNGITLTNGQLLQVSSGGVITNFLRSFTIKTSGDLGGICYDIDLKTWGTGNQVMLGRATFTRGGQYVRLNGATNDELQWVVQDNQQALVQQYVTAQGYVEQEAS